MTTKLTFSKPIDTSKFTGELAKSFDAYRKAADAASKLRAKFDEAFSTALVKAGKVPAGQVPFVSHKWGKLTVAYVQPRETSGVGFEVEL